MTPQQLKHKTRVLKHIYKDVVQDVDGYYVWFPVPGGAFSAADLRMIATLLDEANRLWDQQVADYFKD